MDSYDLHSESGYLSMRKGRKLLAEKKRRNRINQCLKEIRDIVCLTEKQNDPNYEKMEKAEILETTVNYLRGVRKITRTQQETKHMIQSKFQQGFSQCAEEMLSYIQSIPGVSDHVQNQLKRHLKKRVAQVPAPSHPASDINIYNTVPTRHIHPSARAYMNLSQCITPEKECANLSDSGYGASPLSSKPCNASDSELCNVDVRSFVHDTKDSRIRAWLQSTLVYSQQAEQRSPWRPW